MSDHSSQRQLPLMLHKAAPNPANPIINPVLYNNKERLVQNTMLKRSLAQTKPQELQTFDRRFQQMYCQRTVDLVAKDPAYQSAESRAQKDTALVQAAALLQKDLDFMKRDWKPILHNRFQTYV